MRWFGSSLKRRISELEIKLKGVEEKTMDLQTDVERLRADLTADEAATKAIVTFIAGLQAEIIVLEGQGANTAPLEALLTQYEADIAAAKLIPSPITVAPTDPPMSSPVPKPQSIEEAAKAFGDMHGKQ